MLEIFRRGSNIVGGNITICIFILEELLIIIYFQVFLLANGFQENDVPYTFLEKEYIHNVEYIFLDKYAFCE